jgi:UDP-glucose 4-epimerase
MKRVLVTGGTGYIGQSLLSMLEKEKYNITLLSRVKNKKYKTVICDLYLGNISNEIFSSIDTVFHLAGYAHTSNDKDLHEKINYEATIKLAEIACNNKVKQFIYLSSTKAGVAIDSQLNVTEEDQTFPEGAYGRAKKNAEDYLIQLSQKSKMKINIIRSSLVYGREMKGNLRLMMNFIEKNLFFPLPNFNNKKSMIHVDDVARAMIFLSKKIEINSEIFYLTDGNTYSNTEIYERLLQLLGKTPPQWKLSMSLVQILLFLPPIKRRIRKLICNECYSSNKINKLGFEARYSLWDSNEKIF